MTHLRFVRRSKLETPQQEVQAYLKEHRIPACRQRQVSLLFAESMLLELQGVVMEWQAMLGSMQQAEEEIKRIVIQSN